MLMKKLALMCLAISLIGVLINCSVWAHSRYNFGLNLGYFIHRQLMFLQRHLSILKTKKANLSNHRLITGIIVVSLKDITLTSSNVQKVGCKSRCNHPLNKFKRGENVVNTQVIYFADYIFAYYLRQCSSRFKCYVTTWLRHQF